MDSNGCESGRRDGLVVYCGFTHSESSGPVPAPTQAMVKTNMPSPRSLNSVQSAEHGLLLWCPIDGGRTRIGYVFSEKLQQKWGTVDGEGVSEEAIEEEARLAMEPFELEFEQVDWFTIYVSGREGGGWRFALGMLSWVAFLAGYWTTDG